MVLSLGTCFTGVYMSESAPTRLLMALAMVQLLGPYALFHSQRWWIHQSAHERIESSEAEGKLRLLKIPYHLTTHSNKWFQPHHAREFRYLGQMYDVARSELRADTVWYWCVSDERETALINHLHAWIKAAQHQPDTNGQAGAPRPLWHEPGFFPPAPFVLSPPVADRQALLGYIYAEYASPGWPPRPHPPQCG